VVLDNPLLNNFIAALEQLSNPEMVFKVCCYQSLGFFFTLISIRKMNGVIVVISWPFFGVIDMLLSAVMAQHV